MKMRSSCGKYNMDVAIYLRLGTIVIFDLKFDTHDNPGSIFKSESDFGFFFIPYLLV